MKNGDLRRFYPINKLEKFDFVRLNENGLIPAELLPSYVDDVIEGYFYEDKFYEDAEHTVEIAGEVGKIYVDLVTGYSYRWAETMFVQVGGQDLSLILANFAPLYDETATYEVGDLVVYQETLFVCKSDIETAEVWNEEHWDAVDVAELLADKQDEISAGTGIAISGNTVSVDASVVQEKLVSGTNIKTINGTSVLGTGDIVTPNTTYQTATVNEAGLMPALASTSVGTQTQNTKFLREDGSWSAPSYTADTNTWRAIKVNGTQKLNNDITSGALDLVAGTNVTLNENSGAVTIAATDTTYTAGTGIDITNTVIKSIGVEVLTTAPTSANTDGLKFVVLPSETGVVKYSGYLYVFLS